VGPLQRLQRPSGAISSLSHGDAERICGAAVQHSATRRRRPCRPSNLVDGAEFECTQGSRGEGRPDARVCGTSSPTFGQQAPNPVWSPLQQGQIVCRRPAVANADVFSRATPSRPDACGRNKFAWGTRIWAALCPTLCLLSHDLPRRLRHRKIHRSSRTQYS
jgi:hypothetical protein